MSGWRWIVCFLISVGLNVWIFNLWSVGVWFRSIGCFLIIDFSIFYILGCMCLILCFVFLMLWVRFFLISFFIMKGLKSLSVIFFGNLYWYIFKWGLMMIIECLE